MNKLSNLVNLMLLVGDELPKGLVEKGQPIIGRAHIDGPGARLGGDRIKIPGIQAKNMFFTGDKQSVPARGEEQFDKLDWV